MNRKVRVVLAGILILFVGIFLLEFLIPNILYLAYSHDIMCEETMSGWICKGSSTPPPLFLLMNNKFYSQCLDQGGRMNAAHGIQEFVCELPLEDAGKTCNSSTQCMGPCFVDEDYLKQRFPKKTGYFETDCSTCQAKCYKYNVTCNPYPQYTLDQNGKIQAHFIC